MANHLERLAQSKAFHPVHPPGRAVAEGPAGKATAAPRFTILRGNETIRLEVLEDLLADLEIEGIFGRLVEVVRRLDKLGSEGVLEVVRVLGYDVKALGDAAVPTPKVPVCDPSQARGGQRRQQDSGQRTEARTGEVSLDGRLDVACECLQTWEEGCQRTAAKSGRS
jgi:hypothetical protein